MFQTNDVLTYLFAVMVVKTCSRLRMVLEYVLGVKTAIKLNRSANSEFDGIMCGLETGGN